EVLCIKYMLLILGMLNSFLPSYPPLTTRITTNDFYRSSIIQFPFLERKRAICIKAQDSRGTMAQFKQSVKIDRIILKYADIQELPNIVNRLKQDGSVYSEN